LSTIEHSSELLARRHRAQRELQLGRPRRRPRRRDTAQASDSRARTRARRRTVTR